MENKTIEAAVIVAHPDDETIWAGGTIMMHPEYKWIIVSLCRASDPDRAPKFRRAAIELGSAAFIGDLDDGPDQAHLPETEVERTILHLLPEKEFDLVITHSPFGEYTRHKRHEQTGEAMLDLWKRGKIRTSEIWLFAYADNGRGGISDLPRPIDKAHSVTHLPEDIWQHKKNLITGIYGFSSDSYESAICQRNEAFWVFRSNAEFERWMKLKRGEK